MGEQFDRLMTERMVSTIKTGILKEAVGNYTKSYETWKRVYNVVGSFRKEISKKTQIKVLDLGCGDAYHLFLLSKLEELKQKDVDFLGVDLEQANIMLAEKVKDELKLKNINFVCQNFEEFEFPKEHFEIVLCTDVVEHLFGVDSFLQNIYGTLKPGGLAIITTPNDTNAIVSIARVLKGQKKSSEVDDSEVSHVDGVSHGHVAVRGYKEWKKMFLSKGFSVEKVKRSSLILGGPKYNKHPICFAFLLIIDRVLDGLSFMNNFAESHTYLLRKGEK